MHMVSTSYIIIVVGFTYINGDGSTVMYNMYRRAARPTGATVCLPFYLTLSFPDVAEAIVNQTIHI